ncbi:MAG: M23 family metallopeptidase, partial [Candidatus Aegiribacteria sp.]|nr:M23 family metallopeptidase [Candidatus Aegiribacteria sp.]
MKILLASLLIVTSISIGFDWPLFPLNQTHKIDGDYGHANIAWEDASPSNKNGNFHAGIDLHLTEYTEPGDPEIVYAVESGWVTYVEYLSDIEPSGQWVMVICETLTADEGWAYLHVDDPIFSQGQPVSAGNPIAVVFQPPAPIPGFTPHLHFQRSYPEWTEASGAPEGLGNPLEWLLPPLGALYWHFIPQPAPPEHPWCYFIADLTIAEWDDWGSIEDFHEDTLAADELQGSVDIIQGFSLITSGDVGTQELGACPVAPYRIEWDCVKLGNTTDADEIVFNRRVVSFEGNIGAMNDYEKYQQFYFKFHKLDVLFPDPPVSYGDAVCITNCGDAVDWDGINNIEESCWNTALEAEGTGESYHPRNMVTPDGLYRIDVTAYAWDVTEMQVVSIECMLCNTKEIAQQVRLSDAVTDEDIWHAEWVASYDADGFTPEKNIYTNITAQPGTTMDIEITFSGPMSTTVLPWIRFTKPKADDLIAEAGSPEWTSTNQPDGYYDTWHGTVDLPTEGYSGWLTMKIKAHDISDIGLLDPSIADPKPPSDSVDEEYTDDHHGFGIAFSSEEGWPVLLEYQVNGSPALGDLDGDGDLDIAVQSNKGVVELIDEEGNILQTLASGDWSGFHYQLYSSPAVADLDLDGDMDVLAVHPSGCNAWDAATGSSLSGWPVEMGWISGIIGIYPSRSAPAICDLIGDAHPEVVICRHLDLTQPYSICTVWMFDYLGNIIWQRPLETGGVSVASTAAVGDIASNIVHRGSEVLVCTSDGFISNFPPPDGGRDWNSAVYLLDP